MTIKVNKIYSYQTLVYKNGSKTFRRTKYIDYMREIGLQARSLGTFTGAVKVIIHFKNKTKVLGDIDNITKPILDTLQEYGIIDNDKNIHALCISKTFGSKENTIEIEVESIG